MTSRKKKTTPVNEPEEMQPQEQSPAEETPAEPEMSLEERIEQVEMENAQLRVALEAEQARSREYLDAYQRGQAEFINYKRRMDRDQQASVQVATGNALRRYLDVADDLERALKKRPTQGDGATWAEGIDLIYRKFLNAFDADGLKLIEAQGQEFDPNLHEAISHEEHPEFESGQVIEVVQAGYTIGDRVLRPARVRVAK